MKKHLQTPMGGFTLLELMITVAIVGILASIATPNYIKFRDQARAEMALTGIRLIEKEIAQYLITYGELPKDLSLIGMDHVLDPWGRPYEYLVTQGICDEKVKDNKNKKSKKDDKGKNESYLAGFRRIFLEPAFLFSGFNIAFIQLVEFNKIFPQEIILSLLAKKDEDDKDKKGKDAKDKDLKDGKDKDAKDDKDKDAKDAKDKDAKDKKDKDDKDDKDKKDKDDQSKKGKPRKDHQMHPINCDYDLYSVGKDGKSTAPLTAKVSQDDIIRANNGGYVGLVSNY